MISGASRLRRIFINLVSDCGCVHLHHVFMFPSLTPSPYLRKRPSQLIKIASAFQKEKILSRVKFVTMDDVRATVPPDAMPSRLGGIIDKDVKSWVNERLARFPVPDVEF